MSALYQSQLANLQLLGRGKVRDLYQIDAEHLLLVASDRLSAFDVVLPQPIPKKGEVLTRLSRFWFKHTAHLIPNHLISINLSQIIPNQDELMQLGDRALIVRRLNPLPIEAIVRGYLAGSGWKDYQKTGSICGIELPTGLLQAEQLPTPLYTPSTKADRGQHDENIDFAWTVELLGRDLAEQVRAISLALYAECAIYAQARGILIADTKFEFGLDQQGKLYLIDELFTPDSSRFWAAAQYQTGISPPSFDKQIIRDYLETLNWNKTAPGPQLPQAIIERTAAKYHEVEKLLINSY